MLPISDFDYQRMFRVITTHLAAIGNDIERSCIMYSLVGAKLIQQHYGKCAIPVAGAAFYCVETRSKLVNAYATHAGATTGSNSNSFHCWIECDGYIIDLMAPLFLESLRTKGFRGYFPARMFQKPLASMAQSFHEIKQAGEFFLVPNPQLGKVIFDTAMRDPRVSDVMQYCGDWFLKDPAKMPLCYVVGARGRKPARTLNLNRTVLAGAW